MRLPLLAALALLALAACDVQSPQIPEEEPEEERGPISIEYRVDAPDDIQKFIIEYTGADGETVRVDVSPPFPFPYAELLEDLPPETQGTFALRITGIVSSGAVSTRIIARQDGARIAEDQDGDAGTPADPDVSARSEIVLGAD